MASVTAIYVIDGDEIDEDENKWGIAESNLPPRSSTEHIWQCLVLDGIGETQRLGVSMRSMLHGQRKAFEGWRSQHCMDNLTNGGVAAI